MVRLLGLSFVMVFGSAALAVVVDGGDAWADPSELHGKKLIECGHGFMNPAIRNFPQWMADHPEVMSAYPFDGVCLRIWVKGSKDRYLDEFGMSGSIAVAEADVQGTIEAYKKVKWGSLTDNFLYWFLRHGGTSFARLDNDAQWNRVLNNVRLMGKVSAECGFKGIFFDTEDYDGSPFTGYGNELAKRRGKEWIDALQAELPDPVIMFTFIYDSSPYAARFNSFMNGILDGITGKGRIVNAYENTFYWGISSGMHHGDGKGHAGGRARFATYRDDVARWRVKSDNPKKYDQFVEVGAACWWESDQNGWPGWPWPNNAVLSNVPLSLAYSDEYVWCWNEHTNFYTTLSTGLHAKGANRLDPWIACTTNKTLNQGTEQVASLSENFETNPMANGWYFDFDALAHEPNPPFTFSELPYIGPGPAGWSSDHQSLKIRGHRRGTQRHRYVHPVKAQTQTASFSGSIDFRISEFSTDSRNVMVVGLFNAAKADNANSLTLQVRDARNLKIELIGRSSTVTVAPTVGEPLSRGPTYRFRFRYDAGDRALGCHMYKMAHPWVKIFQASTSAKAAGEFSMDEYGLAMWNVDETTTAMDTALQYMLLGVHLNTPAPKRADKRVTPH